MKIRIKFQKQGIMKFIGHLDMMRYFQKAMRRAEVDIRYSGGFSPHQIMSFAAPLGVGILSNGEYLDIEVNSTESSEKMTERLNAAMSEGVRVVSYRRLDDSAKSAMSLVAAADYTLGFRPDHVPEDPDAFYKALSDFYAQEQIPVIRKSKKGERETDIKPLIYRLEEAPLTDTLREALEAGRAASGTGTVLPRGIRMRLCAGSADNIKPALVMEAFYEYWGRPLPAFTFQEEREEVYACLEDGEERRFVPLEALGEYIE